MREIIEKPHSGKMKDKHEDKQKKRKISTKIKRMCISLRANKKRRCKK